MSQAERRGRLHCSRWPDLDWENNWVMLSEFDDFDRSIFMDARSGRLHEAFDIPYGGPYDLEVPRTEVEKRIVPFETEGEATVQQVKDQISDGGIIDWSNQWSLC